VDRRIRGKATTNRGEKNILEKAEEEKVGGPKNAPVMGGGKRPIRGWGCVTINIEEKGAEVWGSNLKKRNVRWS